VAPRVNAPPHHMPRLPAGGLFRGAGLGALPLCGCDLEDSEEVCEGYEDVIDRSD